jgi:hypothetical protein
MPLVLMLAGVLLEICSSLVGRVLLALAIQAVSYKGLDLLLANVIQYSMNNFTGLPSTVVGIIGLFRVDEVLSILAGAVTASMTISGVKNGVLTKFTHK